MSLQTFHPSCTTALNFHIRTIFTSCSLNPSVTIPYWDKMVPFLAPIYARIATQYFGIVPAYLLSCISIRALEVTIRNNRTCAKRKWCGTESEKFNPFKWFECHGRVFEELLWYWFDPATWSLINPFKIIWTPCRSRAIWCILPEISALSQWFMSDAPLCVDASLALILFRPTKSRLASSVVFGASSLALQEENDHVLVINMIQDCL